MPVIKKKKKTTKKKSPKTTVKGYEIVATNTGVVALKAGKVYKSFRSLEEAQTQL